MVIAINTEGYGWSKYRMYLNDQEIFYGEGGAIILKYDIYGKAIWCKSLGEMDIQLGGGSTLQNIEELLVTKDDGCAIIGSWADGILYPGGGLVEHCKGGYDIIFAKYSKEGTVEAAKSIGGADSDTGYSLLEMNNDTYLLNMNFRSKNIKFSDKISMNGNWNNKTVLAQLTVYNQIPEVEEMVIENTRKRFFITTDIKEIDNIKGGSISGEDKAPYETIKYGDSSTKEIKMTPDENYEIIGITVNGEEYNFVANEDGSYTMPAFDNVTENKHVVVTYSLKNNKITINKVDKDTKAKLTGAKFKLDQIEERSEPNNNEIIGKLADNGQEYTEVKVED